MRRQNKTVYCIFSTFYFFLILIIGGLFSPPQLFADTLDSFKTDQAFPLDTILTGQIADLESLEEVDGILARYLQAIKKSRDREEKNLLSLAIAYLYIKKTNYSAAVKTLRNNIAGNFILEDFRLYYEALALRKAAERGLDAKSYGKAIRDLRRAVDLLATLHRSYPGSPFYGDLPRNLAEAEGVLGDAYYRVRNYKAAWQAYQKSLQRNYPDNAQHRLRVNLALAKAYGAAGDLSNATDIYASIVRKGKGTAVLAEVRRFLDTYGGALRKRQIDTGDLLSAVSPLTTEGAVPAKTEAISKALIQDLERILKDGRIDRVVEQGVAVLTRYPGTEETKKAIKEINRFIATYLRTHPWDTSIEGLMEIYPSKVLSDLGYELWRNQNAEEAARVYEQILKKYPLEMEVCHSATYYLGRIAEDKKDYAKALDYYHRVGEQYDYGPYTTAAFFKIPWVERQSGQNEAALTHFKRLLDYYESSSYARLKAGYPQAPSFLTATYYWLAQTEEALGNGDASRSRLRRLTEEFPLDFYAIIGRVKTFSSLKGILDRQEEAIAHRRPGLGDLDRKHLARAERLISIGFLTSAKGELMQLDTDWDRAGYLFYVARLFNRVGGFQKSMKLSSDVAGQGHRNAFSHELMESLFPKAFFEQVHSIAEEYGVNPFLVLSVIRQESAFDPKIVSRSNAIGLMQLLPSTAAQVAHKLGQSATPDLQSPGTNIHLGVDYLNGLLKSFDGSAVHALAAYNAGPHRVKEWQVSRSGLTPLEFVESIPYQETRDYVKRIIRNYAVYRLLYQGRDIRDINEILTIPHD